MESQVHSDTKGVLADITNQVQDLATQTIQLSDAKAKDLIAQAGVEFRCNTNFVKAGVIAQLQYLYPSDNRYPLLPPLVRRPGLRRIKSPVACRTGYATALTRLW